MSTTEIRVNGLRVEIAASGIDIVDDISFEIAAGEVLGLVGESGSGKTTVGLALLGHSRRGAWIARGAVSIGGAGVLGADDRLRQAMRGRIVAYIPQDPGTALNPALRLGEQLEEMLAVHEPVLSKATRETRVAEVLRDVALPDGAEFRRRYPHQVSGGQLQRLGIAMAFACRPRLVVLDEPTTGLDVTTQAHVLRTVRELCGRYGVAALYVSHDLSVVAELANRVAVMYAGRLAELGTTGEVFGAPHHPYTRRLLQAMPDPEGRHQSLGIPGHAPGPGHRPEGCAFSPRCQGAAEECTSVPPERPISETHAVRCWHPGPPRAQPLRPHVPYAPMVRARPFLHLNKVRAAYGRLTVLNDITFDVNAGECVALVGQSGSGKTTLARTIAGLHPKAGGTMLADGKELPESIRQRPSALRKSIQYVFQNPYASLNPRRTIAESVARPLSLFFELSPNEVSQRVVEALQRVSLPRRVLDHYPDQLSGGERQRVAIARALAAEPSLLICDEVTSSLDVSVQASIVELLTSLRAEMNLAMLFVTHNLILARNIADRIAVMNKGRIVELSPPDSLFTAPRDEYTRQLLSDVVGMRTAA